MKPFIILLVLMALSNFSLAQNRPDDLRTTGQKLREQKITHEEVCNTACESKFQSCYKDQIKNGFRCAGEVVTCKNRCKKQSGKK